MQILVIDDDELSRELLTLLLEVEGYEVVSAASGDDGLSVVEKGTKPFDAVLSDLQMPGISGAALAQALRNVLSVGVPIIAMSGSDSRPLGTPSGAPPGFDGFLLKPFSVADLRAMLEDSNDRRTVRRDASEAEVVIEAEGQESPALNEEVFLKMRDLMPSMQLGQMYALCIADARARLTAMDAFAAAKDDAAYRREAHAIKGGAGMIGAEEIYRLATEAEHEGIVDESRVGTSRVTARVDQIAGACERLERILGERLQP